MTSTEPLDNLRRTGKLQHERPGRAEIEGLLRSGEARLADGKTLAPLGGYDDDLRLVLVGALRADCASLSITRDSTGYRVKLLRNGSAAGCAFVLPDDGLPVSLDE